MKKELTEVDKAISKIRQILHPLILDGYKLEVDKIAEKSGNLYVVGRFSNGIRYEQKYLDAVHCQN